MEKATNTRKTLVPSKKRSSTNNINSPKSKQRKTTNKSSPMEQQANVTAIRPQRVPRKPKSSSEPTDEEKN